MEAVVGACNSFHLLLRPDLYSFSFSRIENNLEKGRLTLRDGKRSLLQDTALNDTKSASEIGDIFLEPA